MHIILNYCKGNHPLEALTGSPSIEVKHCTEALYSTRRFGIVTFCWSVVWS